MIATSTQAHIAGGPPPRGGPAGAYTFGYATDRAGRPAYSLHAEAGGRLGGGRGAAVMCPGRCPRLRGWTLGPPRTQPYGCAAQLYVYAHTPLLSCAVLSLNPAAINSGALSLCATVGLLPLLVQAVSRLCCGLPFHQNTPTCGRRRPTSGSLFPALTQVVGHFERTNAPPLII